MFLPVKMECPTFIHEALSNPSANIDKCCNCHYKMAKLGLVQLLQYATKQENTDLVISIKPSLQQ